MNTNKNTNREFGADVVRCVAVCFVIGVHFFLHNGFYSQPQKGIILFSADAVRWLTFSCVPLFLVLTGYLKSECRLHPAYYKGILPILLTWLFMSGICIGFKIGWQHIHKNIWEWIADIFNYQAANYAWYIELYIGLFLLIPFLNALFHAKAEQKYHKNLLCTMLFVVFVPSLFNGFVINGVELNPIPDYFVSLWPIAYYFIGAYMRKYLPQPDKRFCVLLIFIVCMLKAAMTYYPANGEEFNKGVGGGYSDFLVAVITILIFLLLYQMHTKRVCIRYIFAHISKRSLHIYLVSAVFDNLLIDIGIDFSLPQAYWWTFPLKCIIVFGLSLLASEITYPLVVGLTRQICRLNSENVHKI